MTYTTCMGHDLMFTTLAIALISIHTINVLWKSKTKQANYFAKQGKQYLAF